MFFVAIFSIIFAMSGFTAESPPDSTSNKLFQSVLESPETNKKYRDGSRAIFIYQSFISSQDTPSCVYTPSCSEFGRLILKKHGYFRGIPIIGDRLQRCHHGATYGNYPFDHESGRFIDPVEDYPE